MFDVWCLTWVIGEGETAFVSRLDPWVGLWQVSERWTFWNLDEIESVWIQFYVQFQIYKVHAQIAFLLEKSRDTDDSK